MRSFADLRRVALETCIPLNVTFEITLRCNLRCTHCYNFDRDRPYPRERQAQELTREEILRVIDELRDAGCLFLLFTGGETLSHPHLVELAAHARERAMQVLINTNGILLSPSLARRLADAGVASVNVSLYGAERQTHDLFVQAPGAFERTLAGVNAALDAGLGVHLSFTLTKHNAGQVEGMLRLASQLKVQCLLSPQMMARYDGTRSSLDHAIQPSSLDALYRGPMRPFIAKGDCNPDRSVQCSCARSTCGISAVGEVYPCIGAPLPSGNIREKPFAEIWRSSPTFRWIRALRNEDFKACHSCSHRAFCRRSSGVIYNNTGDYVGPARFGDDATCMEAEVLHRIHDEERSSTSGTAPA